MNSVGGDPVPHCHLTATSLGVGGICQFPSLANGFDCDASGHFRYGSLGRVVAFGRVREAL